jgi:Derlin-2/3
MMIPIGFQLKKKHHQTSRNIRRRSLNSMLFLLRIGVWISFTALLQQWFAVRASLFPYSPNGYKQILGQSRSITRNSEHISIDRNLATVSKSILTISRGGVIINGDVDDEDESDSDDVDEFEESDDMFLDFDVADNEIAEADFAEDNMIDRLKVAWKKTPPLTQGYLAASAAATAYGYVFCKNQFPSILVLDWKKVLTRLQIWRPFTSFLNFGPLGLGYIMTAQFVWVYMSTLERLNHNRPYDFWIMILFGQIAMVIGYPVLKLSPRFLGHNLSTYLVYIWSRYHEGIEVNMFELFNTRAELLPWFFLAQTFLLEGEPPVLDFLGIVFGHIYHHLKTVGVLRAPESLTKWYEESENAARIRELYKPISSDFDVI